MKCEVAFGRVVFHSDEFRAFAIRWLGFDPDKVRAPKTCTVYLDVTDGLAEYTLEARASQELPVKTVESGQKFTIGIADKPGFAGVMFTEEALRKMARCDPRMSYDSVTRTLFFNLPVGESNA